MVADTNSPLVERLRAVESSASDFIGDPDPKYVTCWHRNPDGPEAADLITRLSSALEELRAAGTTVFDGLNERIDEATDDCVPVFLGIADLSDALHKADAALNAVRSDTRNLQPPAPPEVNP